MKRIVLPVLLSTGLLSGCGPDQIISDFPSPDGKHHVEVRKCAQRGSLTRSEKTQVSLLKAGESEQCNGFLVALAQFQSFAPDDQLQIEWISDVELRAWHPAFEARQGPDTVSYHQNIPVRLIYAPAQ